MAPKSLRVPKCEAIRLGSADSISIRRWRTQCAPGECARRPTAIGTIRGWKAYRQPLESRFASGPTGRTETEVRLQRCAGGRHAETRVCWPNRKPAIAMAGSS